MNMQHLHKHMTAVGDTDVNIGLALGVSTIQVVNQRISLNILPHETTPNVPIRTPDAHTIGTVRRIEHEAER